MTSKFPGHPAAVGHWARNPYRRIINGEQIPAKVRVLLQDKMRGMGKPAYLWMPVQSTDAGVVACTCVNDTTGQADQPCYTCYGTKYAPGYLRFAHETLFWASAEASGWTLTNCTLDTTVRPHRVLMDSGATSATSIAPIFSECLPHSSEASPPKVVMMRRVNRTLPSSFTS